MTSRMRRASRPVFSSIYFVIQSYLQLSFWSGDPEVPFHVTRQRRLFRAYAGLVAMLTILSCLVPQGGKAALLGIMIPGAGFLHWAGDGQFVFAITLSVVGFGLFTTALVLWFATGNVIAPVITWMVLVVLSAKPHFVGLDGGLTSWGWPFGLAPLVAAGLGLVTLRPIRTQQKTSPIVSCAPIEWRAVNGDDMA